ISYPITDKLRQGNGKTLIKRSFFGLLLAVLGSFFNFTTPASSQSRSAPPTSPGAYRALLDQYCVTCHNERAKTAGLTLDKLDLDRVADAAETWEKVVRKLRGGMMPPQGRPRPAIDDTHNFVSSLETSLD